MQNWVPTRWLPTLWILSGEWRAHPVRMGLAVLAIAVGVALGFAVHMVNSAALASFGRAVASRFQKKLDRLPNIGAADMTAITHGGTSNALAATTATKPPSIRLSAIGSVNSVSCSRR